MTPAVRQLFIALLFAIPGWGAPAKNLEFDGHYTLFDVLRIVGERTDYDIDFPFADPAAKRVDLRGPYRVEDLFGWINRYYLSENHIALRYTLEEKKVRFHQASSLSNEEQAEVLSRTIFLSGKNLGIGEVLKQAEKQTGLRILLPFDDRVKGRGDYNWSCALGELTAEVQQYYKNGNGRHLGLAIEKDSLVFFDNGSVRNTDMLDIQVLPRQSLAEDSTLALVDLLAADSSELAHGQGGDESPLLLAHVEDWLMQDAWVFIHPDRLRDLLLRLVRPHEPAASFSRFFEDLRPFLHERPGYADWRHGLVRLDAMATTPSARRSAFENIESRWIHQLLDRLAEVKQLDSGHRSWNFSTHAALISGHRREHIGPGHPAPLATSGSSFEAGARAEYNLQQREPWSWTTGLSLDRSWNLSDSALLEYGSLQVDVAGIRRMNLPELKAISPHLAFVHESDLFGARSIQDHQLLLLGSGLHWHEHRGFLDFDRLLQQSDIELGLNLPHDRERSDFTSLSHNRSSSWLALHHRFLLLADGNGYFHGPHLDVETSVRKSNSVHEELTHSGFGLGYRYQEGIWGLSASAAPSWWKRDLSSRLFEFEGRLQVSPWQKGEVFFCEWMSASSRGGRSFENVTSHGLKLGLEVNW